MNLYLVFGLLRYYLHLLPIQFSGLSTFWDMSGLVTIRCNSENFCLEVEVEW